MTTALLIVDIQNDYFPRGAYPLVGAEEAAARAGELVAAFRSRGLPVVHVQHIWDEPGAAFMVPGTDGVRIHDAVQPAEGEPVIQKRYPNAFRETALHALLDELEVDELVVCGMMSNLCVDSTVRAAGDLGFRVTLAHDACAAPDLVFEGHEIAGADVHATFMAALGEYAAVVSVERVVESLTTR